MSDEPKDEEPHEPWMNDPPCPGCGVTHKRTRVGKSMTYIIEFGNQKNCGYKGSIPWKQAR